MKKILFLTLLVLIVNCFSFSQDYDTGIVEKLSDKINNFHGIAGLYVHNLVSGETIQLNADTVFPTASLIKIPILYGVMDKIEKGELNYIEELAWFKDSINYDSEYGIVNGLKDGKKLPLAEIISMMITYSDNHASLWCQKLAGGGETINKLLEENGFKVTRVNSRTPGREKQREVFGWGMTNPREMGMLLEKIYYRTAISKAASEEMHRILSNIFWDGEALSEIPPEINAISKQGAVDESRSEVVLVNAPSGAYVFCVITKNQADTGWNYNNEGFMLIREISRILWEYFEPDYKYVKPEGREKFFKSY
ncbi:MAG: serine hydrolase [Ignavibacteriaceae bacterium]|nr:serine hydrolase [Ignavibacteriaceae bacterium]